MKSLNTKLVLSALGVALLATPALAQKPHRQVAPQTQYQAPTVNSGEFGGRVVDTYPNPQTHSGSEQSRESGNDSIGGE